MVAVFVLCRHCFWCALLVAGGSSSGGDFMQSCPTCKSCSLDSLPISRGERYRLDIWPNGNVDLDFAKA
ncbi:MAG: hypothetical protein ABI347_10575 [Nitrososphaera sp.]